MRSNIIIYSLMISSQMQDQVKLEKTIPILKAISTSQNVILLTLFISFLDEEAVEVLAASALRDNRSQKFYKIILAKYFMIKYLNRVDRSIFFLFFQQPYFKQIDSTYTSSIAYNLYSFLLQSLCRFQHLFRLMSTHLTFLQHFQQFRNTLETIIFEPDLPLPKMKRETIAMFASTPLQQHLATLLLNQELQNSQWIQEELLELRNAVEGETEVIEIDWHTEREKIEAARFKGYLVGQKPDDYIIPGFHTHNIVVFLLGLCSQAVSTYLTILNNVQDPLLRMAEFLLRSTLYRNLVLALEEKFQFISRHYTQIYRDIYNTNTLIPSFHFYRPALSMWLQNIGQSHKNNRKIYAYIISKLREENLRLYLRQKSQLMPSFYKAIQQEFELQLFSNIYKQQAYEQSNGYYQLQGFIDCKQVFEIIAKDYQDYFIDISINEYSVHWINHSEQQIINKKHYSDFTAIFVNQSVQLARYIFNRLKERIPSPNIIICSLKQLIKSDLEYLSSRIICQNIVKAITDCLNIQLGVIANSLDLPVEDKKFILQNFSEKDDLITYFAKRIDVSHDCPPKMKFYFDLTENPYSQPPKNIEDDSESQVSQPSQVYLSEQEMQ